MQKVVSSDKKYWSKKRENIIYIIISNTLMKKFYLSKKKILTPSSPRKINFLKFIKIGADEGHFTEVPSLRKEIYDNLATYPALRQKYNISF